jgi:GNAT superfamily N-acetyltransferase
MDPPGLDIQLAGANDLAAVVVCVAAVYAQFVARFGRAPPAIGAICAGWIAAKTLYIVNAPGGKRARGVLVMRQADKSMLIEYLAVHPRFQGHGFGRRLMKFAEDTARARELRELLLYTNELLPENAEYYQSLGYEEVGRLADAGFRRVFMRKLLADPPSAPD